MNATATIIDLSNSILVILCRYEFKNHILIEQILLNLYYIWIFWNSENGTEFKIFLEDVVNNFNS